MIGESSGVTTLINNERITRENQVRSEDKKPEQAQEAVAGNFSDVTSFSSEALALSRNVVPAEGSAAQGQVERQDQSQGKMQGQESSARFLDIRV
ncbi:MAG: hypothetical protein WBB23_16675 [Desulforhopalus sp.]